MDVIEYIIYTVTIVKMSNFMVKNKTFHLDLILKLYHHKLNINKLSFTYVEQITIIY